ncbi:hypothetical protein [Chitinophaga sancti]|uniref:Uncharacterized protein n=1 Tax=Chitinophaga sancti TaxID=1004 RepID=A0A1K1RWY6_9BACT|nr:hypothetical protein [Chitinophaga sancti]WQD64023.1 hypothetical protein U0033_06415 [Chitinophaga sancti]WQG90353.1 hypothetical protein SR876_02505 [Chitinophaga sancti]SFW76577.1 hypothetical protein SAMN05661012_04377 [Chitinophaga sancti]
MNTIKKENPIIWVKFLLILLVIFYAWNLANTLHIVVDYVQCKNCHFSLYLFLKFFSLYYIPLAFYKLSKPKKLWGWIYIYAEQLFSLLIHAGMAYTYFAGHGSISGFLLPLMIRGFFVCCLCINPMAEYFGAYVGYRQIARTVIVPLAVIYILIMYLF